MVTREFRAIVLFDDVKIFEWEKTIRRGGRIKNVPMRYANANFAANKELPLRHSSYPGTPRGIARPKPMSKGLVL